MRKKRDRRSFKVFKILEGSCGGLYGCIIRPFHTLFNCEVGVRKGGVGLFESNRTNLLLLSSSFLGPQIFTRVTRREEKRKKKGHETFLKHGFSTFGDVDSGGGLDTSGGGDKGGLRRGRGGS